MGESTSKKYLDIAALIHAVERVVAKLKEHMRSDIILYEPTRMKYLKIAEMLEFCTRTAYELARCPREDVFQDSKELPPVVNETDDEFPSDNDSIIPKISATKCVTTIPGVQGYICIESTLPDGAIVVPSSQLFGSQVISVAQDKFEISQDTEESREEQGEYTPKKVMANYYKIANRLDSDMSLPFMPQVRSCASFLSEWIQDRFQTKATLFHYNSDNIRNWADKFIVSFGYYWNIGKIDKFGMEFEKWLQDVKLDRSSYPLPKFISVMDVVEKDLMTLFLLIMV